DIAILDCKKAPPGFHARFDVRDKTYEYKILNRPLRSALSLRYCWHIRKPLDIVSMREAICLLEGTHDFSGFENTGSQRAHPVRTIFEAKVLTADDRVDISLTANGFLRCMVRNIVGTLVEVGLGKRSVSGFAEILEKRDRSIAGTTAPARGLFLINVRYQ
ncbi:MAG: tRNA pseudouridine synthase A, partial [Deltaproteobacteria bacterium]|nr:tRNA pseudouridine synthase A [Deltaproteobacteria bacterium]